MATRPKRPRARRSPRKTPAGAAPLRVARRQLARMKDRLEAERKRHARRLAAAGRAGDRRLAALLNEITTLRHHQARAEALIRLVAERDAALALKAERIAQLEDLLRTHTHLG
jgi:hypothetical protein